MVEDEEMKNCENIVNLLEGYLAGTLAEAQRAEVESHLAECELCRKEVRLFDALRQTPAVPAPPILRRNVMERLRAEKTCHKVRIFDKVLSLFRFHFFVWGAAAAVIIFSVVIGIQLLSPRYYIGTYIPDTYRLPSNIQEDMVAANRTALFRNEARAPELETFAERALLRDADREAGSALNILNRFNASKIKQVRKIEKPAETFYSFEISVEDLKRFETAIKNTNIRIVKQQMIVASADSDSDAKAHEGGAKNLFYQADEESNRLGEAWKRKDAPALLTAPEPVGARVAETVPALGGAAGSLSPQSSSNLKSAEVQVADERTTPIVRGAESKSKMIQGTPSRKSGGDRYYQVEIGIRDQP